MHIAEEAGHVYSLLFPLFGLGTLTLDQGDFAGAVAPLERGLEICRTREVPLLLHDLAWALGAAYHGTGRRAEGVALMEDAARGLAGRTVGGAGWPGRLGALVGAYVLDGRLADATRIAQDGLAAARQRGERGVEGQILRLLGDIAAHPDRLEVDIAEAHYRQAQALAEALGLRPLLAHCHLGLGKLYGAPASGRRRGSTSRRRRTMFGEMDMRILAGAGGRGTEGADVKPVGPRAVFRGFAVTACGDLNRGRAVTRRFSRCGSHAVYPPMRRS